MYFFGRLNFFLTVGRGVGTRKRPVTFFFGPLFVLNYLKLEQGHVFNDFICCHGLRHHDLFDRINLSTCVLVVKENSRGICNKFPISAGFIKYIMWFKFDRSNSSKNRWPLMLSGSRNVKSPSSKTMQNIVSISCLVQRKHIIVDDYYKILIKINASKRKFEYRQNY